MDSYSKEKFAMVTIISALILNLLYTFINVYIQPELANPVSELTSKYYALSPGIVYYSLFLTFSLFAVYHRISKVFLRWEVASSVGILSILLILPDYISTRIILTHPEQTSEFLKTLRFILAPIEILALVASILIFISMMIRLKKSKSPKIN